MKKIQKYMMIALMGVVVILVAGCQKEPLAEEDFSQDYDIPWVVSTITSVTPLTAPMGGTLTITGTNLGSDWIDSGYLDMTTFTFVSGVRLGTLSCVVQSQSDTQLVIEVPAGNPWAPAFTTTRPVDISIINYHNRTFVYKDPFTPIL
jgi:hypothetical protein